MALIKHDKKNQMFGNMESAEEGMKIAWELAGEAKPQKEFKLTEREIMG